MPRPSCPAKRSTPHPVAEAAAAGKSGGGAGAGLAEEDAREDGVPPAPAVWSTTIVIVWPAVAVIGNATQAPWEKSLLSAIDWLPTLIVSRRPVLSQSSA